jgi:hypothetical protein
LCETRKDGEKLTSIGHFGSYLEQDVVGDITDCGSFSHGAGVDKQAMSARVGGGGRRDSAGGLDGVGDSAKKVEDQGEVGGGERWVGLGSSEPDDFFSSNGAEMGRAAVAAG